MIHEFRNKNTGYSEMFDVSRFEYIANLVKQGKGTTNLSDIECFLHSIMKELLNHKTTTQNNK